MKAILCTGSGSPDVLKVAEVEKPTPKDTEILVKIQAATVTSGDVIIRRISRFVLVPLGLLFGFRYKKIPGHELAGEIESLGRNVKRFKKGDLIFGTTTGLSFGANAEYICLPEKWKLGVVTKKPDNTTFEEAAAVPIGGMTALQILKKANIKSGQKVLIYGASGSVGTFALQLAKHFGADVTGVCSTANVKLVRSLGAKNVIDYTEEDFTETGETYDVIFDTVGKINPWSLKKSKKKGGVFLSVKSSISEKTEDLEILKELIQAKKIRSVIDRRYPLEETAEAHRYVEKGHKKGNVVITMEHKSKSNHIGRS